MNKKESIRRKIKKRSQLDIIEEDDEEQNNTVRRDSPSVTDREEVKDVEGYVGDLESLEIQIDQ